MAHVTSADVAAYEGWIEHLARPYIGRQDAELDDLMQEGRIAVWQTLQKGIRPSAGVVQGRMSNWVRLLARQRRNEAVSYFTLLPLDDYSGVPRAG